LFRLAVLSYEAFTANFTSSSILEYFEFSFACFALENKPLSPVNVATDIPANIIKIIIVITRAINVIPLSFFISFPPQFYNLSI